MKFKEFIRQKPSRQRYILAVDAGGTTTNFGFLTEDLKLTVILQFDSKQIQNFTRIVQEALQYAQEKHGITVSLLGIAAAGIVACGGTYLAMTNCPWTVDLREIGKKTGIKQTFLLNDFQAIGYGIDVLSPKQFLPAKRGKQQKATRVILGAGTGLGKSMMVYGQKTKQFMVLPSEGGHGDIIVLTAEEQELRDFIKKKNKKPVEWEDVLSGRGIQNIYHFLESSKRRTFRQNTYMKQIRQSNYDPFVICCFKDKASICRETLRLFVRFYARCAKNFALDLLASGGVYIAGGIAIHNPVLFTDKRFKFVEEFTQHKTQKKLLQEIAVQIIRDEHIGLYGAANFALQQRKR